MFNVKELSWIPIMCALLFAPTLCMAAAGDLDLTFGDGGLVTTDIPMSSQDFGEDAVVVQADGKILVALDSSIADEYRGGIHCLVNVIY